MILWWAYKASMRSDASRSGIPSPSRRRGDLLQVWGLAQFNDGKPAGEAAHKTCFAATRLFKDATLSSPVKHLERQ
jgi:hypothetical protein